MEDKLRALLAKIENADVTDERKDKMMAMLVDELEALVQPVLLKYVDPKKLESLANTEGSVTVEAYLDTMKDALTNKDAFLELTTAMEKLLVDFEAIMKEGGLL